MRSPTASSWLEHPLPAEAPTYPDLAPFFPCAVRMQRAAADLLGIVAAGARDTRPWLDHGAWPADRFPLHAQTAGRGGLARQGSRRLPVRSRRRRRRPRDPGRPGPCRDHRAGAFPLFGRRREGTAPGRAARLHAQGNREALHRARPARGASPRRTGLRRFDGRLRVGLLHGARIRGRLHGSGARRLAARASAGARARRQSPRRPRRARQRCRPGVRPVPVLPTARRVAARFEGRLRPPAADGQRRSGGHRGRCRPRGCRQDRPAMRCHAAPGEGAADHLRRARRPAGSLHRHRPGQSRTRRRPRPDRARGPGQRPGEGLAPRPSVAALRRPAA